MVHREMEKPGSEDGGYWTLDPMVGITALLYACFGNQSAYAAPRAVTLVCYSSDRRVGSHPFPIKTYLGVRETMTITVHVPDSLLEDLGETPEELRREILRVAAIHLYSRGLVSQGRGAQIAGLSRWEFIQALGRAEVPACQVTSEELEEVVERAHVAHRQRLAAHPSDQGRSD